MPESYSVNQLKTWSKCQRKYEFDTVRKLSWPSNPKNFRLGKGVHQMLDYESRHLPLAPIVQAADADIVRVWQALHQSRWTQLPVLASEWGFSLEVEGSWLYGRIDRIVQDGDRICILDWKTGTGIPLSPEDDWQTVIYLYAVYEAQRDLQVNVSPEQFAFVYVQVKGTTLKEVEVPYSQARHNHTRERLTQTLKAIQTTKTYILPRQCPDRFCPYFKICGIESRVGSHRPYAYTGITADRDAEGSV